MSNEVNQPDPLDGAVLQFEFTVAQINAILNILGQSPYVASAPLISLIQSQGEPQFRKLQEAEKIVEEAQEKNEGQNAS
jgi:hypothetical protein